MVKLYFLFPSIYIHVSWEEEAIFLALYSVPLYKLYCARSDRKRSSSTVARSCSLIAEIYSLCQKLPRSLHESFFVRHILLRSARRIISVVIC